jgi:acylphosphatase
MKSTRHFLASGKVQNVGFRIFVHKKANEIGVCGWVRNLEDGRVEVIAYAELEKLDLLEKEIRQGPRFSMVQGLVSKDITSPIEFNTFIIETDGKEEWQKK